MTGLSKLALKGSSKVVCDYFEFAINNILFQRGIYPAEDFQTVKKYDLPLVITIDEDIKDYLNSFLSQIKKWVYGTKLHKLILQIVDKLTTEVIERWEFNLEIQQNPDEQERDKHLIKKEIQAIIRQITSSITFLPILDGEFTFNILAHTEQTTVNVPTEWADAKDTNINDFESVDFNKFLTSLHSVGTKVSYKVD